jgi:hypothetical protein
MAKNPKPINHLRVRMVADGRTTFDAIAFASQGFWAAELINRPGDDDEAGTWRLTCSTGYTRLPVPVI